MGVYYISVARADRLWQRAARHGRVGLNSEIPESTISEWQRALGLNVLKSGVNDFGCHTGCMLKSEIDATYFQTLHGEEMLKADWPKGARTNETNTGLACAPSLNAHVGTWR